MELLISGIIPHEKRSLNLFSMSTNGTSILWFSQAKKLAVVLEAFLYLSSNIQSIHQQILLILSLGYIKIGPFLTLHLLLCW